MTLMRLLQAQRRKVVLQCRTSMLNGAGIAATPAGTSGHNQAMMRLLYAELERSKGQQQKIKNAIAQNTARMVKHCATVPCFHAE